MISQEFWKPCKCNPSYLVSTSGRVYSLLSGKILIPEVHRARAGNYLRISLQGKRKRLHVLIMEEWTWETPKPDQNQVNHKDGNPYNCSIWNLEWTSNKENQEHKHKIYRGLKAAITKGVYNDY